MADDLEIVWHKEQIAENRAVLEQLESGNTAGGDIFPETQAEIDLIEAPICPPKTLRCCAACCVPRTALMPPRKRIGPSSGSPGSAVSLRPTLRDHSKKLLAF